MSNGVCTVVHSNILLHKMFILSKYKTLGLMGGTAVQADSVSKRSPAANPTAVKSLTSRRRRRSNPFLSCPFPLWPVYDIKYLCKKETIE